MRNKAGERSRYQLRDYHKLAIVLKGEGWISEPHKMLLIVII